MYHTQEKRQNRLFQLFFVLVEMRGLVMHTTFGMIYMMQMFGAQNRREEPDNMRFIKVLLKARIY